MHFLFFTKETFTRSQSCASWGLWGSKLWCRFRYRLWHKASSLLSAPFLLSSIVTCWDINKLVSIHIRCDLLLSAVLLCSQVNTSAVSGRWQWPGRDESVLCCVLHFRWCQGFYVMLPVSSSQCHDSGIPCMSGFIVVITICQEKRLVILLNIYEGFEILMDLDS